MRALIERMLPWYDADHERERDLKTDRIVLNSEMARSRAEIVIAEYQVAEKEAERVRRK